MCVCTCAEKVFNTLILVLPRFSYISLVNLALLWEKLLILIDFGQTGKTLWKVFNQCQLFRHILILMVDENSFQAIFPNRCSFLILLQAHQIIGLLMHIPSSAPVLLISSHCTVRHKPSATLPRPIQKFLLLAWVSGSVLFLVCLSRDWLQLSPNPFVSLVRHCCLCSLTVSSPRKPLYTKEAKIHPMKPAKILT